MGISIAYLVKKESITLLITTFILVFLLFISGFLLPIERMSAIPAAIAKFFPGKLALNAFNMVVFYDQGLSVVVSTISLLCVWFFFLVITAVVIKKVRKV